MTWRRRRSLRTVSSETIAIKAVSGNFLNSLSAGAKTVKGPSLLSVSTSPAAWTAATNPVNPL
uniref:Uncharacterized protein n=1 Tax=Lepeophtheirus salmonis TaxID=72036 RepID=A0A0K2TAX1_LEPSM